MPIRHRLTAWAAAVLTCTLACLAAPTAVWCQAARAGAAGAAAVPQDLLCSCGHGPDAQCPMHKHHQPAAPEPAKPETKPDTTSHWCAGCHDGLDTTLTSFIGLAAPIVDGPQLAAPGDVSTSHLAFDLQPLDGVRPPINPPPRG